jgi:hypothetical protein
MAGIDVLNQFPKSKMAAAADIGQSRFMSTEGTVVTATPALKSGSATMASVAGTTSTATLLTLCGLTTSFSTLMFTVVTSATGVAFTPPTPAVVYPQGSTVTFNNVSTSANQVTVLTAAPDVVTVNYVGT